MRYTIEKEDEDGVCVEIYRHRCFFDVLAEFEMVVKAHPENEYHLCKVETVERKVSLSDDELGAVVDREHQARWVAKRDAESGR